MGQKGPEFYDNEVVFATYMAKRTRADSDNEIPEKPIFDELVRDSYLFSPVLFPNNKT